MKYPAKYCLKEGLDGADLDQPFLAVPHIVFDGLCLPIKDMNPNYDGPDEKITGADWFLWMKIVSHAGVDEATGKRNPCFVAVEGLSKCGGRTKATTSKSLTRLKAVGLIRKVRYQLKDWSGAIRWFKTHEAALAHMMTNRGWAFSGTAYWPMEPFLVPRLFGSKAMAPRQRSTRQKKKKVLKRRRDLP